MKIAWIELTNYIGIYNGLGLNNIRIDFSTCKTNKVLIKGLNGSGKSTLYNAVSVFSETNDFFIPGVEARKNLCVLNNGVRYIIRYIHGVDNNGNRQTTKGYISKNINGVDTELNPNGNISSCKDILFNEFNLDANFMALSQLSTEDRGLAYKIPSARKKFVNNIISALDIYNNINKTITKKSSIFKSTINSLTYKIDSIGDEMQLQLNLKSIEDRLNYLNSEKESIIENIAKLKVEAEDINSTLQQNNYDSVIEELSNLASLYKSLSKDISTKLARFELNDINALTSTISDLEHDLITIDASINQLKTSIPSKLAERESESSKLQDKTEKLNSLQSDYNYMEVKDAVTKARSVISEYDIIFNEIGLTDVDLITKDEFEAAMESLTYIMQMIGNLTNNYSQDSILKVLSNPNLISNVDTTALRNKIDALSEEKHQLDKELVVFEAKRSIADELINRPKECKINSCYFIKSAMEANANYPKSEFDNKQKRFAKIEEELNNSKSLLESTESYQSIIADIKAIERELNSKIRFISKLPIGNGFKDNFILKAINGDLSSTIDKLYKYADVGNFIEEYRNAKDNLHKYEVEYKIYESKNELIESIIADIKTLTDKTNELANEIDKTNQEIKELELTKANYESTLVKAKLIMTKYTDEFVPCADRKEELEVIKASMEGSVDKLSALQAEINVQYNALGSKESEIKNISDERDKLKHQSVMLQEYKHELEVYNNKYMKIEKIKYYSSPSTGIQTLFMELYMNKTISIANNLLSLLFGGEFVLQPFIINESEFRIPCVGNGLMHDDISSMSTAQKCMISMILSFSLLYQSSTKYNIIKLDEIDGGLDSMNRPFFTTLLDNLMNMLKCEQAFLISHNSELDDTSCDIILLKDDPYSSLVSETANIIWKA